MGGSIMSFDDENYDILTDLFLANDSKCATKKQMKRRKKDGNYL
jgi:hypothetical protein